MAILAVMAAILAIGTIAQAAQTAHWHFCTFDLKYDAKKFVYGTTLVYKGCVKKTFTFQQRLQSLINVRKCRKLEFGSSS